jgi:hypothetical protein
VDHGVALIGWICNRHGSNRPMVQGEQPYSVDALIIKKAWKGLCFIAAKKLSLFLHSSKKMVRLKSKKK